MAVTATGTDLQRIVPSAQDLNLFVKLDCDANVSPWVEEHIPEVIAQCRSVEAVEADAIDQRLVDWVNAIFGPPDKDVKRRPVLAGNSVHADWFLARRFCPRFLDLLHYRILDVTALKLQWLDWMGGEEFDKENKALIQQFYPGDPEDIAGKPHDAYYDILASIAELNYYRSTFSHFFQKLGSRKTSTV